ncbi:MAG: chorismate mutase [Campylobacterales bacterium]|jgi:isochorismate pyruvate lyase
MKECHSLAEVREAIDQLDDQIVELIAKRNNYIKQAARFKETVEEVKAPERVDAVIQRMRRKALELDLSPNLIANLYKMMIDEMVEAEIAELRNAKDL